MRRFCLCLLFVVISAGASARETGVATHEGDGCGHRATAAAQVETPPTKPATTEKRTVTPSVRSDAPGRLGSLRWHSFLPGMFR